MSLLLVLSALSAPPDGPSHIVGGGVTSEYPATVALTWNGGAGCTGTVVAPNRVMTAAHCIEDGSLPDSIILGDDLSRGVLVSVVDGWMHPDYDFFAANAADIAVLILARSVDVTPVRIDRTPADALVGQRVVYAGYGDTQGTGGDGRRKAADARVATVQGDVLIVETLNGGSCFGDSGGPVYREGSGGLTVAGVVSFGYTDNCFDDGGNTRVDLYADWVLTSRSGTTVADGPSDDPRDTGQLDTGSSDTGWWRDLGDGEVTVSYACNSVPSTVSFAWPLIVLLAVRRRDGQR